MSKVIVVHHLGFWNAFSGVIAVTCACLNSTCVQIYCVHSMWLVWLPLLTLFVPSLICLCTP